MGSAWDLYFTVCDWCHLVMFVAEMSPGCHPRVWVTEPRYRLSQKHAGEDPGWDGPGCRGGLRSLTDIKGCFSTALGTELLVLKISRFLFPLISSAIAVPSAKAGPLLGYFGAGLANTFSVEWLCSLPLKHKIQPPSWKRVVINSGNNDKWNKRKNILIRTVWTD